jgi:hypothetical protein
MKDNKHIQAIPAGVLTQAQTKINEVAALLTPLRGGFDPSGTT